MRAWRIRPFSALAGLCLAILATIPLDGRAFAAQPGVEAFVRGTDGALWHRRYDGTTWGNWQSLGGALTAEPHAVFSAGGRIDVFVRGNTDELWQRTFDGTNWGGWQALGGALTSGASASSPGTGRLDVFIRGADGGLGHRSFDGTTWGAWESLGGVLASDPSAVASGAGIDVFARGTDNQLWLKSFNGTSWSAWQPLGGTLTSGPGAASWAAGHLDVFVRGTDNQLWHRTFDAGAWSAWGALGGVLTSTPTAISLAAGNIDVFARGSDRALWHRGFSTGWSGWESLAGDVVAGTDPITFPVPVYRQTMNLDCETAALQMALASLGHYYSQADLFSLENPDTRPPVMGANHTIVRWGDPYTNYVGNVNGSDSIPTGYGIYYPPILDIAKSHGSPGATGAEGYSVATIYQAVASRHPVVVWVEVGWYRPRLGVWTAWDGRAVRYSLDEHTVVLTGISDTQVRVNDPWYGTQYWVSKARFETSWADFNNMAVIFQ